MNLRFLVNLLIWSVIPNVLFYFTLWYRQLSIDNKPTGMGFLLLYVIPSLVLGIIMCRKFWVGTWNYLVALLVGCSIALVSVLVYYTVFVLSNDIYSDRPDILSVATAHVFIYSLLSSVIAVFVRKPIK